MLVTCPNCQTTFNISNAAYVPGRKARCSNCSFIFPLPELSGQSDAASAEAIVVPPSPLVVEASSQQATLTPSTVISNAAAEQDAGNPVAKSFEDIISDAIDVAPGSDPDSGEIPMPQPKKKRFLTLIILLILVLLIVGGGGFLAYTLFPAPSQVGEDETRLISDLELSDTRQFVVSNNEKVQRMVVVEGKVTNLSQQSKELIIIEASLFDKFGTTLSVQQQYCGVTLSLFEFQILGKEEIKTRLEDQGTILMNNTNILPGSSVPFTTVFFDPPPATYEFSVRIVDAKDTAPEKK